MPPDNGMAFVVLVHLPPDQQRRAAASIQRATAMPVRQVVGSARLAPETIYLLQPAEQLRLDDGEIGLAGVECPHGRPVAIDLLFRALAEAYGSHAACIVLSGAGADGSVGIARIKETGGIAFAQDPQEAEYDAMPRHAITSGVIDFVLPVSAMPAHLLAIWRNSEQISLPVGADIAAVDEREAAEAALGEVLAAVRTRTGNDFAHYKRATILRRMERRMQVTLAADLPAYRDYMQVHPAEAVLLMQDLLISVTNFFRDHEAFAALEHEVIPRLFVGKSPADTVRAWVAGCASGEEAYTIMILLLEYAATLDDPPKIQVFASDIDEAALQVAREGSYAEAIAADVAPERLRQFFSQEPGGYRVSAAVRDRVVFANHNLLSDPPFSRIDLISCRNLLIYLNREVQEQIFDRLHFALRPGGFLLLGSAETPDETRAQFSALSAQQHIYRASAAAPTLRVLPPTPQRMPPLRLRLRPHPANERARSAFSELHQRLLERSTPPSVIVNATYEIVHMAEDAGRFVQLGDGRLSFNLLSMVRPELRSELRLALAQARKTGQPTRSCQIQIEYEGRSLSVAVRVHPEQDVDTASWFALVIFDVAEAGPEDRELPHESAMGTPATQRIAAEVQRLQSQLELTLSEQDSTVEALRTANEELLASNEELRTLAEALETSKEELHSTNEELRTVNQELSYRVDELSGTNDDLTNLIAAMEIATVFLNRDLEITRFTPQARAIFNLIHSDEGRPLNHITHQLDYAQLLSDAEQVLQTLQPVRREVGSSDGQHYLARIAPYRTTRDRIEGLVLSFVDISDRLRAEADLARACAAEQSARIAAEEALKTRDQFLSIASHELRTPMTSLFGYAQLLRKALLRGGGDPGKMVERIIRQSQRIDGLIDQLLDVSRLQRGQFVIERRSLDLAALAGQVVGEFRDTLPKGEANLISYERPLDPVLVSGDAARLEQLLLNLLSNAVKYSPRGAAVQVRVMRAATEVLLEVSDQGIGIPDHVQGELFAPFFRAPNVGAQSSGFGLGLYIVHEIVQRHGGRIAVESAEGAGSNFRVALPLT